MTTQQQGRTTIQTLDQRVRVFMSSTLGELADERTAVARAISALRLTPVLFELGARPHPPQELYRTYLAQSDIFIGIYWQRYGWIGPDMEISGLQDEYELARSLPRLLYVKVPAPDRELRLTGLLERFKAEAANSYRTFRTARELGRLVRDDLALVLSERFATGSSAAAESSRPAGCRARRSLPVATTSLIGCQHEIEEVCRLLKVTDGTDEYNATNYRVSFFYDLAKASVNRMAFVLAHELSSHGATALSLTPGWLRSEAMLEAYGVTESNWRDATTRSPHFAISESPAYVGRAVAALAQDPGRSRWNGKALSIGQLAKIYGFTDLDGSQPDAWRYVTEVQDLGKPADTTGYR